MVPSNTPRVQLWGSWWSWVYVSLIVSCGPEAERPYTRTRLSILIYQSYGNDVPGIVRFFFISLTSPIRVAVSWLAHDAWCISGLGHWLASEHCSRPWNICFVYYVKTRPNPLLEELSGPDDVCCVDLETRVNYMWCDMTGKAFHVNWCSSLPRRSFHIGQGNIWHEYYLRGTLRRSR